MNIKFLVYYITRGYTTDKLYFGYTFTKINGI